MLPMIPELLNQLTQKPVTNAFPARHLPKTITGFLDQVAKGEATICPPIPIPPKFKGQIAFNVDTCIGCWLCMKVCSARAIEAIPEKKKIRIIVSQCISCAQCNVICPKNCLSMSEDYLIADGDRYSEALIVR
jgi:formate hydrogenlyase subunit 6/NADH:ubiquinone oxidoreductase subunit I